MDVGLTRAVVAALDRVVEQPEHAVAIVLVVLGGVDAALGGDRVGPPRAVLVAEGFDVIAQLGQGGSGGAAGQAGAHHDDVESALVGRVDQLQIEAVLVPLLFNRSTGYLGIEPHARAPKQYVFGQGFFRRCFFRQCFFKQ